MPLMCFLLSRLGQKTGIYYIDSTALPVSHNRRISRHKTFPHINTPMDMITQLGCHSLTFMRKVALRRARWTLPMENWNSRPFDGRLWFRSKLRRERTEPAKSFSFAVFVLHLSRT